MVHRSNTEDRKSCKDTETSNSPSPTEPQPPPAAQGRSASGAGTSATEHPRHHCYTGLRPLPIKGLTVRLAQGRHTSVKCISPRSLDMSRMVVTVRLLKSLKQTQRGEELQAGARVGLKLAGCPLSQSIPVVDTRPSYYCYYNYFLSLLLLLLSFVFFSYYYDYYYYCYYNSHNNSSNDNMISDHVGTVQRLPFWWR